MIEQGPNSQNNSIIAFGGASPMYAGSSLDVSNNTIVNDKPVGGALAVRNFSDVPVGFSNNNVFGLSSGQISSGPVAVSNTTFLATEPPISSAPPFTTLIPVCFCAGTLIATPTGERPVEQLTAQPDRLDRHRAHSVQAWAAQRINTCHRAKRRTR